MQVLSEGKFPVKVWTNDIEDSALTQLHNMSNMPFIHKHVAVMGDCHWGMGATVGSVIPTIGAVIPAAVGVDIGCGMCAVPTNLTANDLPDDLKKIRNQIERDVPVGFNCHKDEKHLLEEEMLHVISYANFTRLMEYKLNIGKTKAVEQIGTLGGGNHFIELCLDETDRVWIMLHSGSRGIGKQIGSLFIDLAKKDMQTHFINLPDENLAYLSEGTKHFEDYVLSVEWAQQYASMNRKVMLRLVINALKRHFPQLEVDTENRVVNCHHNYISREEHYGKGCFVTRKGAVRARVGELGIIPGSMGTRSYIVEGLGNKESFSSCSHGAGRKMSRNQAKKEFTVEDHIKATEGVECRKDEGVIDETPMAYKDIDTVMENQKDLVKPLHTLKQFLCVKG